MKRKTISKEKLTINKDGLVTAIDVAYEEYDYTSASMPDYTFPTMALSPTEDIAQQNVFSMSHSIEGKMEVHGADADIEINGVSLKNTLSDIQERLAILQPNPELEKEFQELRELREQYKQLEKNLLEKKQMWETLNKDD